MCAAANRLASGPVALTAVSLYETLDYSGLFAICALFGVFSLPCYFRTVPETSGQSLEELAVARSRESAALREESTLARDSQTVDLENSEYA